MLFGTIYVTSTLLPSDTPSTFLIIMGTPQLNDVFALIDSAITSQQVIQIRLYNQWRTVEPYLIGLHKNTQMSIVYGFCRDVVPCDATPSRWQVFNLDDIDLIELTNYSFQPHTDYEGEYEFMQTVYRSLKQEWSANIFTKE